MEIHGPMLGTQYPPGFRFHPTDQELIIHYLRKKTTSTLPPASSIFAEIDLYKFNPWELPEKALFGEGEWFFFSPRDRKYPNGVRPNRAAGSGYWKATGTDKPILAVGGSQCLGVKKALVFYKGRPPKGIKTDWVMHEYRLLDCVAPSQSQKQKGSMRLDDWVLCRVRQRGSLPPKNNETAEIWSAMPAVFGRANQYCKEKQQLPVQLDVKERSNLSELSSCHMSYLQQGNSEEAESAREATDLASNCREQMVSSTLGSVKRKFCLGSLDDLLLLQQSNRSQFSPADSDSDDQSFLEFLV